MGGPEGMYSSSASPASFAYRSRLLPSQLFEREQQQPGGIAFKLFDPSQMFLLLGLFGCQPLVVFWKSFLHDGAGFHQVVPQPSTLKIELSPNEQFSCFLDSLLSKLR